MLRDGRYLLVTNDPSLSPTQMLTDYRQKDGVERRFRVTQSDLHFSPMYVHLDRRIQGLFLVNLIALLAYRLLERQMRRAGLQLTTRKLIQQLDTLHVIETHDLDGSWAYRLTPLTSQQQALLNQLAQILTDLAAPQSSPLTLPLQLGLPQPLLSIAQRC